MMKTLLVILGPNGVGKSTCAEGVMQSLSGSVYVDADWCRAMNPFALTAKTKKLVTENIFCLLKNALSCPEIQTVIFPYSLHGERKEIFETVVAGLRKELAFRMLTVILTAEESVLRERGLKDERGEERTERAIRNTAHFYDDFAEIKIDTTCLSKEQVVERVMKTLS